MHRVNCVLVVGGAWSSQPTILSILYLVLSGLGNYFGMRTMDLGVNLLGFYWFQYSDNWLGQKSGLGKPYNDVESVDN